VNKLLTATVLPSSPSIDSGQNIILTTSASLGTSPYTYQWFTGTGCVRTNAIPGQTKAPFTTPALNTTTSYSVLVGDSSKSSPIDTTCVTDMITVNPALDLNFSLSMTALDSGQSAIVIANVGWTGGTLPYTVALTSGFSPKCTSDTTTVSPSSGTGTNPQKGLVISKTRIYFGSPSASTYYCVTVSDSSATPESIKTQTILFSISPALSGPNMALTSGSINIGQSLRIVANVSWSGGTSPYVVTLLSGTSGTCSSDTTVVAVLSGGNPERGITSLSSLIPFNSPQSTTTYCATVTDGSGIPSTMTTGVQTFTVNPPLTVTITPPAPGVDSDQSVTVLLTAVPSGGTPSFHYQWNSGPSCSAPIAGQVSASIPTGILTSTKTYSVKVTDSSVGTPAASFCASVTVTLNPPLDMEVTLSPSVIDSGQSSTFSAVINWAGGTPPYTVTLTSGPYSTCSADTATVASKSGVVGTTLTFSASASQSAYYCATVTDGAYVPESASSPPMFFTVNPSLSAPSVTANPATLDSGQTTSLNSIPFSGGTSPYTCQWLEEAPGGSSFTTLGNPFSTGCTPSSKPSSSPGTLSAVGVWHFELKVTDSASVPVTTTSAPFAVTVNTPLSVLVSPATPVVDIGSSLTLTANPSNGLSPYKYQWYEGLICASANKIVGATSSILTTSVLNRTATFSVKVNDSSTGLPTSSVCSPVTVAVVQGPEGVAVDSRTGMIYVADAGTNSISIINGTTQTLVANLSVGINPWGIAVDPYTNMVYVTNMGSSNVAIVNGLNGTNHVPSVAKLVHVGNSPKGVAVDGATDLVYVVNSADNTVTVMSGGGMVFATPSVGQSPVGIAVDNVTDVIYVANLGSNSLSAINGVSNSVATIPVGTAPWGVAVDPTSDTIYVTNSGSGTVSEVSGVTFQVTSTVTVSASPQSISVNPSTHQVFVVSTGGTMSVITGSSVSATVVIGNTPWGIDVNTKTNTIYVSNPIADTVSVVSGSTDKIIGTIII